MMNIASKIRKIRLDKGFSQYYMARELGITQSAYSKIENNNRKINFQNIEKIASALELKVEEIITMA